MREFWMFDGLPSDSCALSGPGDVRVSYGMLSGMADEWAGQLRRLTAGRRCLVGLELVADPKSIAAYLGALRAGYPLLVVEPGQLALGSSLMAAWNPEICISAGADLPTLGRAPDDSLPEPHPDLRVLLSTSGSTGDPKLVRLSARNIAANASSIAQYLGLTPADRAATTLPLHYSYGLSVLNSYLSAGASLVLLHQSVVEPAFWLEARKAGVTSLAFVPHQMDLLAHGGFAGNELPSLRYMTQAGGKLSPDLVRRFDAMARKNGWDLFIMYGQTEAAPRIAYVPPDALPEAAETIGRAIPGGRLWLAAENRTEITGHGQPGELVYEGPNVMMGYATTRADLLRGQDVTDLRTGDVAERTDAGFFRIVGRMKRFVKLYGLRISLDQIEAFLADGGVQAHAVTVDDTLVILHQDPENAPGAIAALADAYGLPLAAFHVSHLVKVPRLSSGKPDQAALRQIAADLLQTREQPHAAEGLAEAMKRATRSDQVGPGDSFNALGGDSLSYLEMQLFLEEKLGRVPQGWENMPLARLEAMIRTDGVVGTSRVRIGVDVLLRLLALSLVFIGHGAPDYTEFLRGGSSILFCLAGYSMATIHLSILMEGRVGPVVKGVFVRLVLPYFLLMTVLLLMSGAQKSVSWYLLGSVFEMTAEQRGPLFSFWFIETLIHAIALTCALFLIPGFRSMMRDDPFRTLVLLIVLATLFRWVGAVIWPTGNEISLTLDGWLYAFFIGWALYFARTTPKKLLLLFLAATLAFDQFGFWTGRAFWFAFAVAMLVSVPPISVNRRLGHVLVHLATATYFMYLAHPVAAHFAKYVLPFNSSPIEAIASTYIGSIVCGLLFAAAWQRLVIAVERTFFRRKTVNAASIG